MCKCSFAGDRALLEIIAITIKDLLPLVLPGSICWIKGSEHPHVFIRAFPSHPLERPLHLGSCSCPALDQGETLSDDLFPLFLSVWLSESHYRPLPKATIKEIEDLDKASLLTGEIIPFNRNALEEVLALGPETSLSNRSDGVSPGDNIYYAYPSTDPSNGTVEIRRGYLESYDDTRDSFRISWDSVSFEKLNGRPFPNNAITVEDCHLVASLKVKSKDSLKTTGDWCIAKTGRGCLSESPSEVKSTGQQLCITTQQPDNHPRPPKRARKMTPQEVREFFLFETSH